MLNPPEEIAELAETFRQFALRALGVELDYSSETLPLVDGYLDMARADLAGRQEAEPVVARAATAYFGEVVRQLIAGFWRLDSGDMLKWEVCSSQAFCAVRPAVVVLECLRQSPVEEPLIRLAPEDREPISRRLAALPEVSEQDYFLPSTRYDVIEIVFAVLRDQMIADGTSDVEFETADYAED